MGNHQSTTSWFCRCLAWHLLSSLEILPPVLHGLEFRAKADEIGSFPNETSCLAIFHLVMVRDHAKHNRLVFAKT